MINPMSTLDYLVKEFDRNINSEKTSAREFKVSPRIDIIDREDHYIIYAELPGIKKEDVKIEINEENILTITGEKKDSYDEEKDKLQRSERFFGKFKRSFQLPDDILSDSVKAKFIDGILELSIPLKEKEKPRTIDINID
jgi:HSP20 family protein